MCTRGGSGGYRPRPAGHYLWLGAPGVEHDEERRDKECSHAESMDKGGRGAITIGRVATMVLMHLAFCMDEHSRARMDEQVSGGFSMHAPKVHEPWPSGQSAASILREEGG